LNELIELYERLITSYLGMKRSTVDGAELRLIPEYGGSADQDVVEWLEKAELVCSLRAIAKPETVIPLRLTGGAFAVYQQLPPEEKRDFCKIKQALYTAFASDAFMAYEQFIARKLQTGETVDVFMAELRKLAAPLGGLSDIVLSCAFVAVLPDTVRQLLRASSRMDTLTIEQLLARARAVMSEESDVAAAVGGPKVGVSQSFGSTEAAVGPVCFECNLPNHLAKDCLLRRRPGTTFRGGRGRNTGPGSRGGVRCYRCNGHGHITSSPLCPGKGVGERSSAPASSPSYQ